MKLRLSSLQIQYNSEILENMLDWLYAFAIVCQPFAKMALIWLGYQVGLGGIAWSSARFYSKHCAASGLHGFISSLFTMGSPICISAWFTHAAFLVAYVCAFVATIVFIFVWLWNRATNDPIIRSLRLEIATLKNQTGYKKEQPSLPKGSQTQPEVEKLSTAT